MRFLLLTTILALPLPAPAAARKPPPTLQVRLHSEGLEREGPSFVAPIELINPPKKIFIRKVPVITERNFAKILPFSAADGSLGCTFVLDTDGQAKIEEFTTRERDLLAIALIDGRLAAAMRVDRRITDGIITIPQGFSPREILILQSRYPTLGQEKNFKNQQRTALASLRKHERLTAQIEKQARQKSIHSSP